MCAESATEGSPAKLPWIVPCVSLSSEEIRQSHTVRCLARLHVGGVRHRGRDIQHVCDAVGWLACAHMVV